MFQPLASRTRRPRGGRRASARQLGVALAAGAALLAAPAAAQADSIAYVKDGNVWLSTPDGARQYQVTFDGGYSTVSQADDGRMDALHGDRLRTFDPQDRAINVDGTKRYDILTPHSSSMPGTPFRGPFDPVISPNGMKIAYTWYYTEYGETPSCNPSTGCRTVYGREGTGFISPDGRSPFDKPGWTERTGWVGPSWTGDGEVLLSDPFQVGNADAVLHTPGDDASGLPGGHRTWFWDPSAPGGLSDGEMTRDKTKVVFVTGESHETLYLYRALGGDASTPAFNCYKLTDNVGRISSPSWSPDGTTLAFAADGGVYVLPVPDFTNDCGRATEANTKRLLIPGATNPDWGPADVPPARPVAPPPGPTPRPTPTPTPARGGATVRVVKRLALPAALKKGLTVKLAGLRAGKLKVTATAGGALVASGSAKVARNGTATATLRFTAKARKRLARKRSVKLVVKAGAARAVVTLKR